jgi:hypothetical protein
VELVRSLASPERAGEGVAPPSFESVLARTRAPSRHARRVLAHAAALVLAALTGAAADRMLGHATPPVEPRPVKPEPVVARVEVRREVAKRPGGLGASLAILGGLSR